MNRTMSAMSGTIKGILIDDCERCGRAEGALMG
ncbi:hypothetical protein EC844_10926 [Acinetobacter calcoaceticus]|uniref:Uncharacterized protein n=1 Tax=Acinetobacter calcoaceticus TaxID=471 RepID=A0A4R1XSC0_ACICA|nr:hypothetical protein EC844_10926 [Acinetobacter calcoaceticus]